MSYLIVALVISGFWTMAWAIHQSLFVDYRRQVAAECGAGDDCRFQIVEGGARPQQIYAGVVRVGEEWLVGHGVPSRSLAGRR